MARCCLLTHRTLLPGWHCMNTDLELSVNNDLEERGRFGFGQAASIQLSDFSCFFPSPDPQIQRLNVSNPALHWQQGCENESRGRVALLRRDRRRARVASPQRFQSPSLLCVSLDVAPTACELTPDIDARTNDFLHLLFSRQEPGI